ARESSGGNSETISLAAYAHAKSGHCPLALAALEELRSRRSRGYVPPHNIALIYNGLGEMHSALEWLQLAYAERDTRLPLIKVDPNWDDFRREPGFIKLMGRMNF